MTALLLALLLAANPSALWDIVHGECVPNFAAGKGPAPCLSVGPHEAVLKDIRGETHYLLIPTARTAGIEAPELIEPGAPNYFADAWKARDAVSARLGRPLARDQIGVGINSVRYRSQDQLHLHIECLAPGVQEALRGVESATFVPVSIFGARYRALLIRSADLDGVNPFRILYDALPPGEGMAGHSLILVGAAAGFYLVDGTAGGEALLDRKCEIGRAQPR
jgi:CDP-diacylglycerol pyrophosphatase